MKYLIVSDIHGSLPRLEKVISFFKENNCDMLCLLGDILNYGPRNSLSEGLNPQGVATLLNDMKENIIAVRGNCDSEVDQMLLDFPIHSDYTMIIDNGIRIFLTHGHIYNENKLPKCKIDIFFYGHTHLWQLEKKDIGNNHIIVCNTGSITFPKGGNEPTFCIYENNKVSTYNLNGNIISEIHL